MHLHIATIILLIFENFSNVLAQGVPMSPCPNIFQYRFNGLEWFGILSVPNPDRVHQLNLQVTLSVAGKLTTNYFGEIELLTRGQYFSDKPVFYKVIFPTSNFPPKLLQIAVNDQVICRGTADLAIFVTQIQLEHTRKYTFLPYDLFAPIQTTPFSFLPAVDSMEMDAGHSTIQKKVIPMPLHIPDAAFDGIHLPFATKKKSPMQNLKDFCGTVDAGIHFNVLQAIKQAKLENYAGNGDSMMADEGDGVLKTDEGTQRAKNKSPLIISNITDDSGESGSKQNSIIRGAWPWLAAIYINNLTSLAYQCSGTLVSSRVVVSAAHCLQLLKQEYSLNEVLVFLGRHNLIDWSEDGSLAAPVDGIYIHPEFNKHLISYDADIAVVILKDEVLFSSFIRPACLWSGPIELEYLEGEQGVVVGWSPGSNYISTYNPVPKILSAPIVSNKVCFRANAKYESISSNRTFCAGIMFPSQQTKTTPINSKTDAQRSFQQQVYRGPCAGDSGAGLMIFRNERWMLRGSVSGSLPLSQSKGSMSHLSCSINQFVIYTDVAHFLDWIFLFMI